MLIQLARSHILHLSEAIKYKQHLCPSVCLVMISSQGLSWHISAYLTSHSHSKLEPYIRKDHIDWKAPIVTIFSQTRNHWKSRWDLGSGKTRFTLLTGYVMMSWDWCERIMSEMTQTHDTSHGSRAQLTKYFQKIKYFSSFVKISGEVLSFSPQEGSMISQQRIVTSFKPSIGNGSAILI